MSNGGLGSDGGAVDNVGLLSVDGGGDVLGLGGGNGGGDVGLDGLGHGVGQGGDLGGDLGDGVSLGGGVGKVAAQPVVLDGGRVVGRSPDQGGSSMPGESHLAGNLGPGSGSSHEGGKGQEGVHGSC